MLRSNSPLERPVRSAASSSKPGSARNTYITQLQSCARGFQGSRAFFDQLTDFLRYDVRDPGMKLQAPKLYRIQSIRDAVIHGGSTVVPLVEVSIEDLPSPGKRKDERGSRSVMAKLPASASRVSQREASAYIVVVEGLPSPTCIETLAPRLNLRPELFLGHLGLIDMANSGPLSSALPTLPSRRSNIVHVRMAAIGCAESPVSWLGGISDERSRSDKLCHDWRDALFRGGHYGATMIRKVHLHDEKTFHVEHVVSMSVTITEDSGFLVTILLDQGRQLRDSPRLPWDRYTCNGHPPQFVPLIPYNTVRMDDANPQESLLGLDQHLPTDPQRMPAFHPISHLQVSSEEECSLLRQSPFFCLFRILTIAALSWTQLLNVVENLIRSYNESAVEPAKHQYASEQLRVVAQLLDDVSKNITNDQVLVEVQHTEGWPWPEDPHLSQKLEALQRALASDHAYLFAQCARLSDQVTSASRSISQAGQLLQNQRSVQEAREVGRLTTLAFLFLPISFISSVFGMNVAELAGNPPIWVYFAIALPVSFVTFVVASWAGVWEGVKALVRAQRARRLY